MADVCDEGLTSHIAELKQKRPEWLAERQDMMEEHREKESPPHEVSVLHESLGSLLPRYDRWERLTMDAFSSTQTVTFSLPPPNVLKRRTSVTRMSGSDRSHLKDASAERISASIILVSWKNYVFNLLPPAVSA